MKLTAVTIKSLLVTAVKWETYFTSSTYLVEYFIMCELLASQMHIIFILKLQALSIWRNVDLYTLHYSMSHDIFYSV